MIEKRGTIQGGGRGMRFVSLQTTNEIVEKVGRLYEVMVMVREIQFRHVLRHRRNNTQKDNLTFKPNNYLCR